MPGHTHLWWPYKNWQSLTGNFDTSITTDWYWGSSEKKMVWARSGFVHDFSSSKSGARTQTKIFPRLRPLLGYDPIVEHNWNNKCQNFTVLFLSVELWNYRKTGKRPSNKFIRGKLFTFLKKKCRYFFPNPSNLINTNTYSNWLKFFFGWHYFGQFQFLLIYLQNTGLFNQIFI